MTEPVRGKTTAGSNTGSFAPDRRGEARIDLDLDDQLEARLRVKLGTIYRGEALEAAFTEVRDEVAALSPQAREIYLSDGTFKMTPDLARGLADLGYDSVDEVEGHPALAGYGMVRYVVENRVDRSRLDALARHGVRLPAGSQWVNEAVLAIGEEDLDSILADPDRDTVVERLLAAHDPQRGERARRGRELGLAMPTIASELDLDVVAGLREAMPKAPLHVVHQAARAGYTGADVKAYGVNVIRDFTREDVEASGLPPAMVKAYHSAGPRLNLDDMRALERRNVSPRQVRDVIGFVKDPRDVASIKDASEVPLELLQEFYGSAEGSGYRREEIAAVAQLHRAGVKTPANVRAFLAGSTAPDWFSHPEGALVAAGRIFGSGVTHKKYHALVRSGVPVDRVADFKDHADPWEAGKEFREAWARTRRSWNRPDTWPYSKRQAATPPVPRA